MRASHGNAQVHRLGWAVVLLATALGVTLALIARGDHHADERWLLGVVGAPSLALEPVRDEVQVVPWADASPVVAELPGGYPVVANTRPTPVWRGVLRAQRELVP